MLARQGRQELLTVLQARDQARAHEAEHHRDGAHGEVQAASGQGRAARGPGAARGEGARHHLLRDHRAADRDRPGLDHLEQAVSLGGARGRQALGGGGHQLRRPAQLPHHREEQQHQTDHEHRALDQVGDHIGQQAAEHGVDARQHRGHRNPGRGVDPGSRARQDRAEGPDLRRGPQDRGGHEDQGRGLLRPCAEAAGEEVRQGGDAEAPEGDREHEPHREQADPVGERLHRERAEPLVVDLSRGPHAGLRTEPGREHRGPRHPGPESPARHEEVVLRLHAPRDPQAERQLGQDPQGQEEELGRHRRGGKIAVPRLEGEPNQARGAGRAARSSAAAPRAITPGSLEVRLPPIGQRTRASCSSVTPRCRRRPRKRCHLRSEPISPR